MKDKKNKNDKIEINIPLNRRVIKYAIIILLLAALIYTIVVSPGKIGSLVSAILSLLSPIIIGCCLAYIVNLLLCPIERFWLFTWRKAKNQKTVQKLKRPICLALSFIAVLGAMFALVFMVIPSFRSAAVSFVDKVPTYIENIESWYKGAAEFLIRYNFNLPETLNTSEISNIASNVIKEHGDAAIAKTVTVTTQIVTAVVNLVLGLVFSVYLLAQKENLGRQAKKIINVLMKPKSAEKFLRITNLTDDTFKKFVTGQLVEACIIGALCFVGMIIFNIPYAAIVSLLVGFTALIPIFGAFIGTGIGAFLILLESPLKAFWFIVFIIVLQQIEGNLIYPRVVGKSVGLPGLWVLAAVTLGGGLFGLIGMLFSVPICSVLYALSREYINKKTEEMEMSCEEETEETDELNEETSVQSE